MLEDKEKFILAKANRDIDLLLQLIMSNEPFNTKPAQGVRLSRGYRDVIFEENEEDTS